MTAAVHRRRFATFRSVFALMIREMSTTYGRSPGGYVWAILEPVAGVMLFTVVMGYLVRTPPLGTNFPLFYASGYLPLIAYNGLTAKIGQAIPFSKPLLAYPGVTYIDAILARILMDVLTQIIIGVLIFTAIIVIYDTEVFLDFGAIGSAILMLISLSIGLGLLNSFLIAVFPIWGLIWAVFNRPMFIAAGILFLIDPLPEAFRDFLLYLPIGHVVMEMRAGFYVSYDAVYVSESYVYICAIVPGVLGLLLLYRYHNDILEV